MSSKNRSRHSVKWNGNYTPQYRTNHYEENWTERKLLPSKRTKEETSRWSEKEAGKYPSKIAGVASRFEQSRQSTGQAQSGDDLQPEIEEDEEELW